MSIESDILKQMDERALAKGWKPCRMAINCWIQLGTETPAEHVDEHHPRARKLIKANLDQQYGDEQPWTPDVSDYTGSRFERRTPIERSNFVDPNIDDAERSLRQSYKTWKRAGSP